jgi:hypothetical protein
MDPLTNLGQPNVIFPYLKLHSVTSLIKMFCSLIYLPVSFLPFLFPLYILQIELNHFLIFSSIETTPTSKWTTSFFTYLFKYTKLSILIFSFPLCSFCARAFETTNILYYGQ